MKIKVTQEHINKGKRHQCLLCPVALALQETLNDHWGMGAHNAILRDLLFPVPQKVIDFVWNYDAHKEVSPFEFEFDLDKGIKV